MTVSTPQTTSSSHYTTGAKKVRQLMQQLQDKICQGLEQLDGIGKFQQDGIEEGGFRTSRVMKVRYLNRVESTSPVWGLSAFNLESTSKKQLGIKWFSFRHFNECCIPAILTCQPFTSIIATLKQGQYGGLVAV